MRVLLVEDEPRLQESLAQQLQSEHYQIDTASDGEEGYFTASEYPLDAAIIDLGLPKLSGIDVIKKLRADGQTLPILILTARNKWQEKVEGLEAGADDYLTKPFQFEELLARLKALLRRSAGQVDEFIRAKNLILNPHTQQLCIDEVTVSVTAFEYKVLEYLARHSNEAISKSRLADYLYPHEEDPDSNVIEVIVGRLRKKLMAHGIQNGIETLRNRGYRFTLFD